jgi:hypothetical protein
MAGGWSPLKQTALPFTEGEATHAGRWNDVSLALSRVGKKCDLHLSRFVRLVFDMTQGGTAGELTKSIRALSERPAWLCCSERKVWTTIDLAEKLGFVVATHRRAYSGSQQENSYSINWAGIQSIITGAGRTTCEGVRTTREALRTSCDHTKEYKLLRSSLEETSGTGTGPGAGPNPRMDSSREPSALAVTMCDKSPILAAARERRIAPKPAGGLFHGIFKPLQGRDLADPLRMVTWHRQQLTAAAPEMGDTEADLLLTLATALYATSLPASEVQSRVGLFVTTLRLKRWEHSVPFVPQARALLDDAIGRLGAAWAGLADEATPMAAEKVGAGT